MCGAAGDPLYPISLPHSGEGGYWCLRYNRGLDALQTLGVGVFDFALSRNWRATQTLARFPFEVPENA